jgi:hypothetical protein
MLSHALCALLEGSHLFLVAQYSDDIVTGHDAQLGIQGSHHLQMLISYSVEHHRVDVL